ncbi:hypothetical protein JCM9140_4856 [Halalkalibacter wakoensis JCM 9140]|uniref:CAAX prenyl protease 2/Lysostaphin resistance protein A-like domain-containing protein n=1 Tax=Halalkalibacter wakoensis JCM 9140 TaxID=1236970 RepID=W4Q964_9BACI|nr:CPBP family glutamic-type intramembrane protease [Halalkalibacter wakoensis]GAE28606.1 hypothetical protein JCM9140_4856 [Halalkalibacter wakoensis JCM 9140]
MSSFLNPTQFRQIFFAFGILIALQLFVLSQVEIRYDEMFNLNYLTFYLLFYFFMQLIRSRKEMNSYLFLAILTFFYSLSTFLTTLTSKHMAEGDYVLFFSSIGLILVYFLAYSRNEKIPQVIMISNRSSLVGYIFFYFLLVYILVFFLSEIHASLAIMRKMTFSLMDTNVLVNLFVFVIMFLLLTFFTKQGVVEILRKSSLLSRRNFYEGGFFFLLVFCLLHLHIWFVTFRTSEPIVSIFTTGQVSVNEWLGMYIGQIFGVALQEEFTFRFVVFWSLFYLIKAKKKSIRLIISLVMTQLLFGLFHVPILGGLDYSLTGLVSTLGPYLLSGLLLSFFYLYTKNLWIPIFYMDFGTQTYRFLSHYTISIKSRT